MKEATTDAPPVAGGAGTLGTPRAGRLVPWEFSEKRAACSEQGARLIPAEQRGARDRGRG